MLPSLPSVNELLAHPAMRELIQAHGRLQVLHWVRSELDARRRDCLQPSADSQTNGELERDALREQIAERVSQRALDSESWHLRKIINATGVVLHTSLGRAPLSAAARQALLETAGACNLEVDVETGGRRYRGYQLEPLLKYLTGCESSLVVNNNAAATLLALQALCAGRDVIISRGELIEIGGSFRLPEIFALSGVMLREVGTTNRTHLTDYERAIGPQTAAIMKVHTSNYRVVGFSHEVTTAELAELAHARDLLLIDDIGSGAIIDPAVLGLNSEPTFPASIAAGADVTLGSGDKLLGGPQCGIVIGKQSLIERLKNHPLARALRIDKLTLAALSATLDAYMRDVAAEEIPTLAMLAARVDELRQRANAVATAIGTVAGLTVTLRSDVSAVGGGSLPTLELPSVVVALRHNTISSEALAQRLRLGSIRVFGRIQQNELVLDVRSVLPEDDSRLALAIRLSCQAQAAE